MVSRREKRESFRQFKKNHPRQSNLEVPYEPYRREALLDNLKYAEEALKEGDARGAASYFDRAAGSIFNSVDKDVNPESRRSSQYEARVRNAASYMKRAIQQGEKYLRDHSGENHPGIQRLRESIGEMKAEYRGLIHEVAKERSRPRRNIESVAAAVVIGSFILAVAFASNAITGYAIANATPQSPSQFGVIFFILGLMGAFVLLNKIRR